MLSNRLRQARIDAGMSQVALADAADMQPSAISHYETGNREPSAANLARLAKALGCSADWLLGHEPATAGAESVSLSNLGSKDRRAVRRIVRALEGVA